MKTTVWRDAIVTSDLDRTAKLVAFVLSSYMNGSGDTFVGKKRVAAGSGLDSVRSVDEAIKRLEAAGYLDVVRSKGGRPNHYLAATPHRHAGFTPQPPAGSTPHEAAGSVDENPAARSTEPRSATQRTPHQTPQRAAPEVVESEFTAGSESEAALARSPGNKSQEHLDGFPSEAEIARLEASGSPFAAELAAAARRSRAQRSDPEPDLDEGEPDLTDPDLAAAASAGGSE